MVKYALLYHQYKAERNIISFSDILILAYEGLRKDTAHEYKRYHWIQVDEVQDLNALQTAIIDELLDNSQEFTVMYLGDEQQAIFSWCKARPTATTETKVCWSYHDTWHELSFTQVSPRHIQYLCREGT